MLFLTYRVLSLEILYYFLPFFCYFTDFHYF